MPVAPDRGSLHATDRMPRTGVASQSSTGRFFQTRQPMTINRVPFEQQRSQTQQAYRSPVGNAGGWRPATGSQSPGSTGMPSRPPTGSGPAMQQPQSGGGAWRRFDPSGSPQQSQGRYQPARTPPTGYPAQSSGGYDRQPMRMNPSIVQPRPSQPGYSQPVYRPSAPAPSSGGGAARPSSSGPSSGGGRSSGGGGGSSPRSR